MPTLDSSSQKNSINTTTDLVADALTILNGDVIVVKAGTWSSSVAPTASAPSATGLTFTQRAAETGGGFNGNMYLWTAVAGSNLGSTVVTLPGPSTNAHHAMSVEVWRSGALDATPVVATGFTGPGAALNISITTEANGSVVTWGAYDNESTDPSGRAYRNSAVEIAVTPGSGTSGEFYWAYQSVPTAGATTYGLNSPAGRWNAAGIEILAAAATPGPPIFGRTFPSLAATQRASW